jgi:hypothetical protein
MAQPVHALARPYNSNSFFSEDVRNQLEIHMHYLRNHPATRQFAVEEVEAQKYEGDMYGLLLQYNIPIDLHWLSMRVSGFTHPNQTDLNLRYFLTPDLSVVEQIVEKHRQVNNLR